MLSKEVFLDRQNKAISEMNIRNIDYLYVPAGADLQYLTGMMIKKKERPIALIMSKKGEKALLCPAFDADYLAAKNKIENLVTWEEHENPFNVFAKYSKASSHFSFDRISLGSECSFNEVCEIKSYFPGKELILATPIIRKLRAVKDKDEIGIIKRATSLTEKTLDDTFSNINQLGIKEKELENKITECALKKGLNTARATVLSGGKSSFPHGSSGDRIIKKGDIILVDLVTTLNNYHADITQTISFGEPETKAFKIFSVVKEAVIASLNAIEPGVLAQEIDRKARKKIEKAGCGEYFTHRLGHGIGLEVHEDPYLVEGNNGINAPVYSHVDVHSGELKTNMVMTIEPAVYLKNEFGVRIEDDIMVTENGYEALTNNFTKDLVR